MCKITNIIFHVNIMLRKLFELITHSKHETNERDLIFIIFLYIYIFTDSIIYIYIYMDMRSKSLSHYDKCFSKVGIHLVGITTIHFSYGICWRNCHFTRSSLSKIFIILLLFPFCFFNYTNHFPNILNQRFRCLESLLQTIFKIYFLLNFFDLFSFLFFLYQ